MDPLMIPAEAAGIGAGVAVMFAFLAYGRVRSRLLRRRFRRHRAPNGRRLDLDRAGRLREGRAAE